MKANPTAPHPIHTKVLTRLLGVGRVRSLAWVDSTRKGSMGKGQSSGPGDGGGEQRGEEGSREAALPHLS